MTVFKPLKQLGTDTLIYGFGSVLQAFIGFLLFPLYIRFLSQQDFGAQDLILTSVIIINYFLIMGLDSGAARFYYDTNEDESRKVYLSSWLWLEIALSIPLVLLLVVFAEPVCGVIFSNRELVAPFRLAILSIPFMLVIKVVNLTLRLTFRARTFSLLTGFGLLIQALMAIVFVVTFKMGIMGVFLAILCANMIQAIVGAVLTARNFMPRMSFSYLGHMLAFGLPLVPASMSLWVLNYSNRYFLAKWTGLEEVGLFGAAFRISALLTVGITAFQNAWPPFAFSLLKDEAAAKQVYIKALSYFVLIAMLASVILSIFAREALLILATSSYETAYQLVPLMLYSTLAWGVVGIVAIACEIPKKSYQITLATILGALTTILMNIIFIPIWGLPGAAAASMFGNILALLYIYRAGQRYFFVEYELPRILKIVIITSLVIIGGELIDLQFSTWLPMILVFKIFLFIVFFLGLLLSRVFTEVELQAARAFVKQGFNMIRGTG